MEQIEQIEQITYEMLNWQQKEAVSMAVDWFKGFQMRRHKKQFFFLAGFAGTGKTTVAKIIADLAVGQRARVVYIAPTGKAASRLRQKGAIYAKTLHQFIYNMRGEDEDGEPIFIAKGSLDESPWLVVLDEASMVGEYDARKLADHGIPVLALGDIGQLEPVRAYAAFTEDNMDFLLTEIERNAGNIVRASMFVRNGNALPYREYDDVKVRPGAPRLEDLLYHAQEDGVVLVSRNATRANYNSKIRESLGFTGKLPQIGEKIMCTFNQHEHSFMNGEQAILLGYQNIQDWEREDGEGQEVIKARIKSLTTMKEKIVKFNELSFLGDFQTQMDAKKGVGGFDYGYALTIHKSQGSEWEKVLVVEESLPNASYAKMNYTAYTRAISELMVFR